MSRAASAAKLCWEVVAVDGAKQGHGMCGHEHETQDEAHACPWTPTPWPVVCDLLVRQVRRRSIDSPWKWPGKHPGDLHRPGPARAVTCGACRRGDHRDHLELGVRADSSDPQVCTCDRCARALELAYRREAVQPAEQLSLGAW